MQDFIRIGGPITSAPLNEDFRRLLNAISIANVNLVFPEENGIVNTINDMLAIPKPDDAQACYVISSGELYRFSKKDYKWHKIMDLGQTFRQGFLNSGAVVLEDYIKLKENSKRVLEIPRMLIYFKNKPGDERYLKGMYLFEKQELDVGADASQPNAYSIFIDYTGSLHIITGTPKEDDVNRVYLGSFLIDKYKNIIPEFIFTLPDIAYTDDRGHFYMYGGEAEGCQLLPAETHDAQVNREGGYYYDEGINFTVANCDEYPVDSDNGSNFNLRYYIPEVPVDQLFYMTPVDALKQDILISTGLIYDKYWANGVLTDVPEGHFTIQQHLVTPNGQNIILYGTELYNSIGDAISNINSTYGVDIDFPHIEATRIVVGNVAGFETQRPDYCRFFTLGRLTQVGTVSPKFADNMFELYSGRANDISPASMRFVLDALEDEDYNELYNLSVLPYNTTRQYFYNNKKYIKDGLVDVPIRDELTTREDTNNIKGYFIADNRDLQDAIIRINNLEAEIWEPYNDALQRWEQSVRWRLFNLETHMDETERRIEDHEDRIVYMEKNKVHKGTTINGFTLGDTDANGEQKIITLVTGDINEGKGSGTKTNLWYTEDRVRSNNYVAQAYQHSNIKSQVDNALGHVKVNPHQLSTDDINILQDTTKLFVTPEQERRIRADKLPDDTWDELRKLDEKNMDSLGIYYIEGNSKAPGYGPFHLGEATKFRFFEDGVKLEMDTDGETLIVECIGQVDEKTVMFKSRYCTIEAEYPDQFGGYVDNAVNAEYAEYVHGIEDATPNQYYGTDKDNVVGIHDLPVYVSTADAESFGSIEQVLFMPINDSVQERHLEESLRNKINNNYHLVYNNGSLKSNEINTFNFGDNMTVQVEGHTATISASGSGGGAGGVQNFVNLQDVDVLYTGNKGKVLTINEAEDKVVVADMPNLKNFMLKALYVSDTDVTKVKKAELADHATLADTASNALKLSNCTLNDSAAASTSILWTSNKIKSQISSQISSEGVNTYSGTGVPANTLGKNGDIYIMIEG